jgi:hypothetical protein
MLIDLVITVAGAVLLLLAAFAGIIAVQGRKSADVLIAPQGTRFGEARRLTRR